ncbi:hypothetical protein [uncultured Tenacibaculum sp.]|uniref:hypothetical protein n=1 Tax=uncultured Tenacibaculum sp. TaxID=174713 RepID=UPI0026026BEA|nr:hypothetical protein [uncultured Tenacibaculum sp.]
MKFLKFSILLIVLFLSCQIEKETTPILEQTPIEKIFQKNETFFNNLNEISSIKNKKEVNYKLKITLDNYDGKETNLKLKKESLNKVQEEVLKQYFAELKAQDNKVEFSNTYIQQIQNKNIKQSDKLFCINAIDFHKKLLIYVNYEDNNNQAREWEDCAHRGCMNCCMYRKTQDLSESNWVDKALFLVSAAQTTTKWFGSCAWDCI